MTKKIIEKLLAIFCYPASKQWGIDYNNGLDTHRKTTRSALYFTIVATLVGALLGFFIMHLVF